MIVDLGGVTTEPSRRKHVAIVSATAATVSLAVLMVLVAPTQRMDRPQLAASAAPTSDSTVVSAASNPMWLASDRGGPFEESMRDDRTSDNVTLTECAPGIGSSPPVHLVLDRSGRVIAAYSSGKAGRFLPLPPGFGGSGWLTVPCDPSDVFAPRINRAR